MIKRIFNCISIHNGGGITYLSMMHNDIDKKNNLIFLDHRAKKSIKEFRYAEIKFFKKSLFRNLFVFKERLKQTLILQKYLRKHNKKEYINEYFLNGIPPLFRFSIKTNKVFVLLQNKNLFSYLNYFDKKLFFKLKFIIYHLTHSLLINLFLKNTDTLIVQTKSMRESVFRLKPNNKILVQEDYWKNIKINSYKTNIINNQKGKTNKNLLNKIRDMSKFNKIFFYPSSFDPHKNHKILFNSFNKLSYNSTNNIKLIVTINKKLVPAEYSNNQLIFFIGNQNINTINKIYKIVDFLIFPSLNESLGLPLIEASFYDLPIISSNLDYVFDVCKPYYTFDPYSEEDIFNKVLESIN